jgi:probable HAF family extracellular repeat protein
MLDLTSTAAAPWDINNAGNIAGQDSGYGGFMWHAGTIDSIQSDSLGGWYAAAVDINSSDVVLGIGTNAIGEYHAFTWKAGAVTELGPVSSLPV